jgi:hypothetical protein
MATKSFCTRNGNYVYLLSDGKKRKKKKIKSAKWGGVFLETLHRFSLYVPSLLGGHVFSGLKQFLSLGADSFFFAPTRVDTAVLIVPKLASEAQSSVSVSAQGFMLFW